MNVEAVDWQEARLPMLAESEAAAWAKELGRAVVCRRGRWWARGTAGFYQPVRPLARLRLDEATRPTHACWCFRAGLDITDATMANAWIPVHLLPNPRDYSLADLSKSQRRRVRNNLRDFDIVALRSPALLLEKGYALVRETHARNPAVPLLTEAAFARWVGAYFSPPRGLLLAALCKGQLLAFNANSAVDGVAYGDAAYIGTDGLQYGLAASLFHAFATVASRCAEVETVFDGLHLRENESLCAFKQSLGLRVERVPARVWFAPLTEPIVRWARPHLHYKLTGRAGSNEYAYLSTA